MSRSFLSLTFSRRVFSEITKIRLQMQGEMLKETGAVSRGAIHVVRQLGLVGLYKGASVCLMRDLPFSMIYVSLSLSLSTSSYAQRIELNSLLWSGSSFSLLPMVSSRLQWFELKLKRGAERTKLISLSSSSRSLSFLHSTSSSTFLLSLCLYLVGCADSFCLGFNRKTSSAKERTATSSPTSRLSSPLELEESLLLTSPFVRVSHLTSSPKPLLD